MLACLPLNTPNRPRGGTGRLSSGAAPFREAGRLLPLREEMRRAPFRDARWRPELAREERPLLPALTAAAARAAADIPEASGLVTSGRCSGEGLPLPPPLQPPLSDAPRSRGVNPMARRADLPPPALSAGLEEVTIAPGAVAAPSAPAHSAAPALLLYAE